LDGAVASYGTTRAPQASVRGQPYGAPSRVTAYLPPFRTGKGPAVGIGCESLARAGITADPPRNERPSQVSDPGDRRSGAPCQLAEAVVMGRGGDGVLRFRRGEGHGRPFRIASLRRSAKGHSCDAAMSG
jgi:hypothetical protein